MPPKAANPSQPKNQIKPKHKKPPKQSTISTPETSESEKSDQEPSNQHNSPKFGVDRIKFEASQPPHATRMGNLIQIANSSAPPSEIEPDMITEEYKLHHLECGLTHLKATTKAKIDQLMARQKQGDVLSPEEEEWLDLSGNLVDEELVVNLLRSLTEDIPSKLTEDQFNAIITLVESYTRSEEEKEVQKSEAKKRKHNSDVSTANIPSKPAKVRKEKKDNNTNKSKTSCSATYADRIAVLNWHNSHGKQQKLTVEHFARIMPELALKQPTLSRWINNKTKIRDNAPAAANKIQRVRAVRHPDIEAMLERWVDEALGAKVVITGEVIKSKWEDFARAKNIPEEDWLQMSSGWLTRFKDRHNLRLIKKHGEAGSVDPVTVEEEIVRVQAINSEYKRCDIYNMDETGLFYAMPPDRGLAKEDEPGVKGVKARFTIVVTANADGSDKRHLSFIGKYQHPQPFKRKGGREAHNVDYYFNKTAWMTTKIFREWIMAWDRELREENRQIILWVDNFSGHIVEEGSLKHIRLEKFKANLTSHIQPCDAGIIRALKAHYRTQYVNRAIRNFHLGLRGNSIYKIDILSAMRLIKRAWHAVSPKVIKNCWLHTKIVKSENPGVIIDDTTQLEEGLKKLQEIGAVAPNEILTADHILNRTKENPEELTVSSIEDIVNDYNNDQEDDQEDEGESEPIPTSKEAMKAVSQIFRYMESMDDPLAIDLDAPLHRLERYIGSQIFHSVDKQTTVFDFFKPRNNM